MPERIRYVVTEDDDDPEHPNVFELPGPAGLEVRLADVKQFFPLAGQFHFRFKRRVGGLCVWVDVGEDGAAVPRFDDDGGIFAKVSRLNAHDDEGRLGTIKSFLAHLGDEDGHTRGVAGLKSYISKACTTAGLFARDEEEPPPPRRAQRVAPGGRRGPNTHQPEPYSDTRNGTSAPAMTGQRPKQPVPPVRFAPKTVAANKSSPDLPAAAEPPKSRSVKSASPPKLPEQPPAADLLGFDAQPVDAPAAQPADWHAFVGLDSTAQHHHQHQPTQQQQPMRPAPPQLDPFSMSAPPNQRQPSQQFDAFAGF
mmetsp:Transcript_20090/g.63166  ORF Transcript_20090/g.63166 Transcript_20090/m.63166 type:complete len:309 (-) Transcript_20090:1256-2182(-)